MNRIEAKVYNYMVNHGGMINRYEMSTRLRLKLETIEKTISRLIFMGKLDVTETDKHAKIYWGRD